MKTEKYCVFYCVFIHCLSTAEGIDRKLAVHYYGRWHFIKDLLPAVEAAKEAGEDGKVMVVLAAGYGGKIDLKDLGLKKSFSVGNTTAAALTYNDIMINDLAAQHPALTFIHAHPSVVTSNLLRSSNTALMHAAHTFFSPLLSPFIYSVQSAGKCQLYALLNAGPGANRLVVLARAIHIYEMEKSKDKECDSLYDSRGDLRLAKHEDNYYNHE
ncbi:hypothetical protein B0H13DRAFT_2353800 [Mycena leptocephala]|nr:hypothetical protein B0H13DRAFT_2353800 [Mycena leptocephala]